MAKSSNKSGREKQLSIYSLCPQLVFCLSVLILSCELQSGVAQFTVSAQINSYHRCIQSHHIVCKFWSKNISVSWVYIVGKWPFLFTVQLLHLWPDVQKNCKILKISGLEFQANFASSITSQNFCPSCHAHSCYLWSAESEGCKSICPVL